jgi:hypothetical protein
MNIVIATTPAPGHVHPMLGIARILVAEGHEVVAFTGSAFRHAFTVLGAYLIDHGYFSCETVPSSIPCTPGHELEAFIGVMLVIGAILWSWIQKMLARKKLLKAIAAPAGSGG